ncbi:MULTISPECIES: RNA 2',3'-cyclic phosphodiesterase [unclassified Thioalkalivibrio]|uniref:RNA 2',3'-cyclic phosphodiesterase n=1 Tax=unclassified Thioalkalivibrio TaxID=2621013 RepID=UPI00037A10CC|nr:MULTISPECIES: RNA 2',3'-cyclic phosphodiesterase [unclassified Thioalkalivibrio]
MDTPAEVRPDVRRVFLALWPDEHTRDALTALAHDLDGPGRPVPRDHLHLTLAFAGTVPTNQADCLAARIGTLACAPIDLSLDHLGYFHGPRITWAGPTSPPPALVTLANAARLLCNDCGIQIGAPHPFRPHLSLRRHAAPPHQEAIRPPILWTADTVVLVESGQNGHPGPYRVLARCGTDHPSYGPP